MSRVLNLIMDWSELWALLIPFAVFLYKRKLSYLMQPVLWYVCIGIVLNLAQDIIWKFQIELELKGFLYKNLFIYNAHSIIRFSLFSLFFIRLKLPIFKRLKLILPLLFFLFILINFTEYQSFNDFSSRSFAMEALILLFFCLFYYLNLLQQDNDIVYSLLPEFWVVTGLSIYVVINFPIFLFYNALSVQFKNFAINIWNVHNLSYIIFCIFLAKAFYVAKD